MKGNLEFEENTSCSEEIEKLSKEEISNSYLVEIAWEVCNQIGGIYTVIKSKVPYTSKRWGDNYFLLGPYHPNQAAANFQPIEEVDESDPVWRTVKQMNEWGFTVHYGRWLINGRPKVVLFDLFSINHRLDEFKYYMWDHHRISLPSDDYLVDRVTMFGLMVNEFFKLFSNPQFNNNKNVIAHFHEWMAGVAIPEIRKENLPVKIVFTTHATMLGRYIAMNDPSFYDHLPFYDWHKEAVNFNIEHIVAIERAAAHGSHVFSTVSDVTAMECVHLLGRKPDVILPNGLNIERFEAMHEFQNLHLTYKEKIHEFVMGHFFHNYSFDLDKTLYFVTSGRFEYYNKGFDVTLEALARLNWKMKEQNIDMNVVMFFITRNPYHSMNSNVLHSRALLEEIQRNCQDIQDSLTKKFFYNMVSNDSGYNMPDLNKMVEDNQFIRLCINLRTWRNNSLPPIVTHNLSNEDKDPIMNFLKSSNLLNFKEDKVKVVYHPDFISTSNPLFRMEYFDFVRGCHLGIFPSYYEPWGYTPLECCATGIPSITSDLSGFGSYVAAKVPENDKKGIYVINRNHRSMDDSAEDLSNKMLEFVKMTRRERIMQRNRVEAASVLFDWKVLGKYYDQAYHIALKS